MKKFSKRPEKKENCSELDLSPTSDHRLIPPEIIIYLTSSCNHANCGHCIVKDNFSKEYNSLASMENVFLQMNELKIPFVSFTGGEPFEYEEGLENIIRLANNNNLFVNQIITNASFAKNKDIAIKRLRELKNKGFSAIKINDKRLIPSLTISMDIEHQKFIPIENILNLIEASKKVFGKFIDLTINYVLFNENKDEVFSNYPWLKNVNVDFVGVCYEGRAKKIKEKNVYLIEEKLKEWDSPCNWTSKKWPSVPVIFPNGEINFCCYFGNNKILSLGNIKNISIKDALRKINKNKFLITLFKYGPVKLLRSSNATIYKKYSYNKCGMCNILLKNIIP